MSEMTHEDALRQADVLVSQELKETEARCRLLAEFISDCESRAALRSAWSEALRELHGQHDYRRGLMRRHSLIRQALDAPVGECPAKMPLSSSSSEPARRTQVQVQVQAQRRHR